MKTLISGLILFFGAHSISIVAPYWRDRVASRIGTLTPRRRAQLVFGLRRR